MSSNQEIYDMQAFNNYRNTFIMGLEKDRVANYDDLENNLKDMWMSLSESDRAVFYNEIFNILSSKNNIRSIKFGSEISQEDNDWMINKKNEQKIRMQFIIGSDAVFQQTVSNIRKLTDKFVFLSDSDLYRDFLLNINKVQTDVIKLFLDVIFNNIDAIFRVTLRIPNFLLDKKDVHRVIKAFFREKIIKLGFYQIYFTNIMNKNFESIFEDASIASDLITDLLKFYKRNGISESIRDAFIAMKKISSEAIIEFVANS